MKSPKIIFEDKNVLVLNKPAGLSVHPDGHTAVVTLVDWLLKKYPRMKKVGEPLLKKDGTIIARPGIVHRLDKETSGVLIVAKNQKSYEKLKEQFKEHKVEKRYIAVVYGDPKKDADIIKRKIGKSAKDFRLRSAYPTAKHPLREAETLYKVDKRLVDKKTGEKYALMLLKPKTGRTHQIRVHLQAEGYPVVGDKLYAKGRTHPKGVERHMLHAGEISLVIPGGAKQTFKAEIPKDIKDFLANLTAL